MVILLPYRYRAAPASYQPGASSQDIYFLVGGHLLTALVFQLQLKEEDQHFLTFLLVLKRKHLLFFFFGPSFCSLKTRGAVHWLSN